MTARFILLALVFVRAIAHAEVLLDFDGLRADAVPTSALAVPADVSMRLVKDAALDAAGYLVVSSEAIGDDFADVRLPLPGSARAGRYEIVLQGRSPERKWLLLDVVASDGTAAGWAHNEELGLATRERRHDFVLTEAGADRVLRLRFRPPGSVELASLAVRRIDAAALIAAAAARWPDGPPDNLFRNSRLPLGLPAGWAWDRHVDDGRDVTLVAVDGATGPSGYTPLRVRAAERVRFHTEPLAPALPGERHTAGFHVRGDGRGSVVVVEDGRALGEPVTFVAGDTWSPVATGFTPNPLARVWALRVELEGDVAIDAFQANDGEALRDLAAAMARPEVALTTGTRSRVHRVDEHGVGPDTVAWRVTAAPAGARLVAKAVNIYGEERALPPVTLSGGVDDAGEFGYAVWPGRALGVYRVEAWVEDGGGRRLGPVNETVVHRVRDPRHLTGFAPASPFGIHTLPTARHLEMAKAIGLNWVRLHDAGGLEWAKIEPAPGQWRHDESAIRRYREAGFEILGLLGTSPLWANAWPGDRTPIHGFWDRWGAPGDSAAFGRYVREVTTRYRDDIRVYEVWNEPWIPRFFSGRREPQPKGEPAYFHPEYPQKDYAGLCRVAAASAAHGVRLVGLNSTGGEGISNRISGGEWTAGVVQADGVRSMEVLSYHHYTAAPLGYEGDDAEAGFRRALGPVPEAERAGRPVWLTEGSNQSRGTSGTFYRHVLPLEPETDIETLTESADALVRYVVAMLAAGNEKVFLYSMHGHGFFGDRLRFTTLVTPDGYLHPDAAAFSTLAWQVEGRRLVKVEEGAESAGGVPGGAVLFRFRSDGDDTGVTVVAPRAGRAVAPREGATDLWGNPTDGSATMRVFYVPGVE